MQDIYSKSYTTHTIFVKGGLKERLGLTFSPDFSIKEVTKESQCYGKIFPNDRIVAVGHDVTEGISNIDQLVQIILKYLRSGNDFNIVVRRQKRGQAGNSVSPPVVQNQETSIFSCQQVSTNQNMNVNNLNASNAYFVQENDGIHQSQQERLQMNARGMEVQRAMQQYQHQMLMQQRLQWHQHQQHQWNQSQQHQYRDQGHLQHQMLQRGNATQHHEVGSIVQPVRNNGVQEKIPSPHNYNRQQQGNAAQHHELGVVQPVRNGVQESSLQNYHRNDQTTKEIIEQKVSTSETSTVRKISTNKEQTSLGNEEDLSPAPDSSREKKQSEITSSNSIENRAITKSSSITPNHSQGIAAKDVRGSGTTENRIQQGIINESSVPSSQTSRNSKHLEGLIQTSESVSKHTSSPESKTLQQSSQSETTTEDPPTQTSPAKEGHIKAIANSEPANILKTQEFKKITLNVEKGSLGLRVDFADMLYISRVRPDSQLVKNANTGDVILSFIINGHEYNKWTSRKEFLDFMQEKQNDKKTIVLGRRIKEKEAISCNSKTSHQETSTCQETDATLGSTIDGKEAISRNSKTSHQETSICQDSDEGTSKHSVLNNDIVENLNCKKRAATNPSTHLNKDHPEKGKNYHKDTGLKDPLLNSEDQNLDKLEPNYDKSLYCDICEKNDGYHSMVIQKCCQCGVCVHEECYMMETEGVPRGKKFEDWQCHACKSVGKSVNAKFGNAVKRVKIHSRPMRCALCNISKSFHAMHPLYNTHGKEGLPLGASTKFSDEGIVWVHTTCALALGLHAQCEGIVFGCYEDGRFDGDEEDEDEEDEVEISPELDLHYYQNGKRNICQLIHHFVIDRIDERSKGILKDLQSQLICTVCKKQSFNSNKIPIQCHAKDCHSAFHVGCARWGSTQAVYNFFPGLNHVDEVSACFCPKHKSLARLRHDKSEDTYEFQTKSEAERKGAHALSVGEDGYIFDVDASSDEGDSEIEDVLDEELEISGKRNKKRKKLMDDKSKQVKRRKEKNKTDPPQKGDGSATTKYFEKKGEITENSQKMIDDLASLLKSNNSNPKKALKRICSHYKEKLSPGIYKKCIEKTEERMSQMVRDACTRKYTHTRQTISKKGNVPERKESSGPKNPWKDLFYPYFQFGKVLPSGWTR